MLIDEWGSESGIAISALTSARTLRIDFDWPQEVPIVWPSRLERLHLLGHVDGEGVVVAVILRLAV